ncbi:MAG: hypothetical protein ACRD82_13595 [Blastocatellia bacterium]
MKESHKSVCPCLGIKLVGPSGIMHELRGHEKDVFTSWQTAKGFLFAGEMMAAYNAAASNLIENPSPPV